MEMYQAISFSTAHPFVFGLSQPYCRPHTPQPECHYDSFAKFSSKYATDIDTVIYNQAGYYLIEDDDGTPGSRDFFRKDSIPLYSPNKAFIERVVEYLNGIAKHVKVVWVGGWIEPHLNVNQLKKYAMRCEILNVPIHKNTLATFLQLDSYLKERIKRESRIVYLSSIDAISFDVTTYLYDCDAVFWTDGDHWSKMGEKRFGIKIMDALATIGILSNRSGLKLR
jgi:hypothetical protein